MIMSTSSHIHGVPAAAPGTSGILATIGGFVFRMQAALVTRRQRRALLALDDRMLADIGLSRSQAYGEATRPMFELPVRHR